MPLARPRVRATAEAARRRRTARRTPTNASRAAQGPRQRAAVRCDHVSIPKRGVFQDALLARIVAENQAETMLVAVSPFEVVDERPMEIGLDWHAVAERAAQLEQMALRKIDTRRVVHFAIERKPITARDAVLGDHDRLRV